MSSRKDWTECLWCAEEDGKSLPYIRDVIHSSFCPEICSMQIIPRENERKSFLYKDLLR